MNKAEVYDLLRTRGIWHEITEHKAVYNMAELTDVALPYPEADAKNLFVRDDKKRNRTRNAFIRGDRRYDESFDHGRTRRRNQSRQSYFARRRSAKKRHKYHLMSYLWAFAERFSKCD